MQISPVFIIEGRTIPTSELESWFSYDTSSYCFQDFSIEAADGSTWGDTSFVDLILLDQEVVIPV